MKILSGLKYSLLKKQKSQLAIWGWWQGKNLGDNWIKESMSKHFSNATFIDTRNCRFQDFGFVICGGGGLFIRDITSQWKAKINVPFGVIGLGAEFEHPNTCAQDLYQQAKFFFVRDKHSLRCMHLPPKCLSYDITFASPLSTTSEKKDDSVLFVWRDPSELLEFDDFREYIGSVTHRNVWFNEIKTNFRVIHEKSFFGDKCNIEEITNGIGFIVSARYHGVVAAIQRGILCIGIDLCPKIRSIMKECGIEKFCLKLNEVGEIKSLIKDARQRKADIFSLQQEYSKKATTGILKSIETAKNKIPEHMEYYK